MSTAEVFIAGTALDMGWRDRRLALPEWVHTTVRAALTRSGLRVTDIDSVVLASQDVVDGRSLSSMLTATAAGGYLNDEVRLADDGAVALALAYARIRAGTARNCVVAAWGRASESLTPEAASNALFDPFFTRPLGMTELTISGLRAELMLTAGRLNQDDRRAAAAFRFDKVRHNPRRATAGRRAEGAAYPLEDVDLPLHADVCVAAVLSATPTDVRVAGVGQSSEPHSPGERDLAAMPALTAAIGRALGQRGRTVHQLDVIELDAPTLIDEAVAVEAMGLAPAGGGLAFLASDPHWNPSGGSAAGYCPPAMGLTRVVEAVLRLRQDTIPGRSSRTRSGLATGASPLAGQCQTAILLDAA